MESPVDMVDKLNFLWKSYHSSTLPENQRHSRQLDLLSKRVAYAERHCCYYQHQLKKIGLKDYEVKTPDDISRLPIIKKNDLIRHPAEQLLTTPLSSKLRSEQSSGTSGTPFTVYYSQQEYFKRSMTFLRAMFMIGYRPGDKLFLLTQGHGKPSAKPWLRWYYASITASRERVADYYFQVQPDVLYGCTTSIKLLAEYMRKNTSLLYFPKAIITTAETLDANTRKFIEEVFQAEVYDFYGLSEVGLVAWECKNHQGYHIAEDMFFPELITDDTKDENQRLLITSLHQQVMPFIRFDTGDFCIPAREPCGCGSTFKLIKGFNGRVIDCLQNADGTQISPYTVTCALEAVPGLSRYQVIQQDYGKYQVLMETSTTQNHESLSQVVTSRLKCVLGKESRIDMHFVEQIELQPGQKYRPVLSLLS